MKKRILAALLTTAVGMSLVWVGAAPAQIPPEIPPEVQIDDPVDDANYVNDGNHSAMAPVGRDHVTPEDASGFADLMKIWFTNDAETVSAHIQVQQQPPAGNGVGFQVYTNPGEGSAGANATGCLRWVGLIPGTIEGGGTYQGAPFVRLHDRCNTGGTVFEDSVEGEHVIDAGPEGSGIVTMKFPRSASPLLGSGATLTSPYVAAASPLIGEETQVGFLFIVVDNTQVGTDYALSDDGPEKRPKKCPSKGKKKGKKKPKPRPTRATPAPSPTATDAPTTPPPGPEVMAMQTTPAPSASPTARPTSPPGQDKPCPRQQGKKKPRPKPRPTRTPNPEPSTRPTPSPSTT